MPPGIRIFAWMRQNPYAAYDASTNPTGWRETAFSITGGKEDQVASDPIQSNRYSIHLPTALVNGKWVSMTSDNIIATNGLKQWSSVPIVIVNYSNTPIEEFNLSLGAHIWSAGSSEGGFGTFWSHFKHLYDDGTNYSDNAGNSIKKNSADYGNPMSVNGIQFNDGARLNGNYDATGTLFHGSTTAIWDLDTVGFCPLQQAPTGQYGINLVDWNQSSASWGPSAYGYINSSFDPSGVTTSYFGDPTSVADPHWGSNASYYSGSSHPNGSPIGGLFHARDCRFERYTTFDNTVNAGNFSRTTHAIGDPRGMGYLWKTHVSASDANAFGRQTIMRSSVSSSTRLFHPDIYSLYTDLSYFGKKVDGVSTGYSIIRGYLIYTLYATGFSLGTTPALGSREGAVSGKYFLTMMCNGRYY